MTTQEDRPIWFQTTVDFRHDKQTYDSGCSSSGKTLEEARTVLYDDMRYYVDLGDVTITGAYINRVCENCNGYGTVFIPQKRNPRLGKNKRCPVCRGKDSDLRVETWVDLPYDVRRALTGTGIIGEKRPYE